MKKLNYVIILSCLFFCCSSNDDSNNQQGGCPVPEPFLFTDVNSSTKKLAWNDVFDSESYTIEYGIAMFELGTGQTITTTESSTNIQYISAVGTYDLYLKANCESTSSNWVGPLNFTTNGSDCGAFNLTAVPFGTNGVLLNWGISSIFNISATSWYIEYGPTGFELGTGTSITTPDNTTPYAIENLTPLETYDFYIKGNCSNGGTSLFTGFTTFTIPN